MPLRGNAMKWTPPIMRTLSIGSAAASFDGVEYSHWRHDVASQTLRIRILFDAGRCRRLVLQANFILCGFRNRFRFRLFPSSAEQELSGLCNVLEPFFGTIVDDNLRSERVRLLKLVNPIHK